jgi:hypothetical protein
MMHARRTVLVESKFSSSIKNIMARIAVLVGHKSASYRLMVKSVRGETVWVRVISWSWTCNPPVRANTAFPSPQHLPSRNVGKDVYISDHAFGIA